MYLLIDYNFINTIYITDVFNAVWIVSFVNESNTLEYTESVFPCRWKVHEAVYSALNAHNEKL